ncbi:MAG: hypothetical protein ACD_51C00333G0001 [uncultured bacterium]|nr:MAG: hypothetical protein ACD_51C00333G0001 [uncultured bacterium]OGJ47823.1 MAG: hypothetical protein A2344_01510 [Candidatus Peregrinibacteria bacterium RIFOXYB12_FULL_41_12]OGJ55332.1 MAG: hypothetical protein A2336_02505 [Candidatus Peregrinibacteria bacterium RIFOXYB2_FULL_41_88]
MVLEEISDHGPEVMTATLGVLGIKNINEGSSKYGQMANATSDDERNEIVRDASGKILTGNVAMAVTTFAAGNALFAYPEVAGILTALKPYFASRYPKIAEWSEKIRADLLLVGFSIADGGYTISQHATSLWDSLPAIGLTALSCGFAIGDNPKFQKIYRFLMLFGGGSLVVGSSASAIDSLNRDDNVGFIMSLAFLILNGSFTINELKEVAKMMGIELNFAGLQAAVKKLS